MQSHALTNCAMDIRVDDVEQQHITSSLAKLGMMVTGKIAKTLQGQIWCVMDVQSKRKCVAKTASKKLHQEKATIFQGNVYSVQEDILNEMRILQHLQSIPTRPPSIINYIGAFHTDSHYYLIMEHGGHSLFHFMRTAHNLLANKRLQPANWMLVVRCIFKQMIEAIGFLHAHNVSHFDVSLENFTLSRDPMVDIVNKGGLDEQIAFSNFEQQLQIKLIDFGLAQQLTKRDISDGNNNNDVESWPQSSRFVGKRPYQCPEIRQRKTFDAAANDVWCAGVCLFMMAAGCQPWKVAEVEDATFNLIYVHRLLKQVLSAWNRAQYFDDALLQLLECIFQPETRRVSVAQIQKHSWLNPAI